MDRIGSRFVGGILAVFALVGCLLGAQPADTPHRKPEIPTTWDESALADWATPIAGLNVRPTHMTAREYYALRTENLRTYPVYYPGGEPKDYWEMLQHVGPKPLIEADKLHDDADWIAAGKRVFDEFDHFTMRTYDPKLIARARTKEQLDAEGGAMPDGSIFGLRWVPTKTGVALAFSNCSSCHLTFLPDGTRVSGAPAIGSPRFPSWLFVVSRQSPAPAKAPGERLIGKVLRANRIVSGATSFVMGSEPLGMWLYRAFGVPWKKDDVHERLKTITAPDFAALAAAVTYGGAILRWNGSPYYPAKVPDLIGFKERKYIDHTATHLHRNIGDLMRYAALVSFADAADFGPHHMLGQEIKRVESRLPDEALYALALYIYSLQPPPNSNRFDESAQAGQKIFAREGCPRCHTPPLYTSNKITLAQGFDPPSDAPAALDLLRLSVGTDPGLALGTRKGTGYYKVPSLKGLWYRGHYLHDGSVASLEEMFDPDRLKESHEPGGWLPVGAKTRAIQGHEFGLRLTPTEREQLIAFLRTL